MMMVVDSAYKEVTSQDVEKLTENFENRNVRLQKKSFQTG